MSLRLKTIILFSLIFLILLGGTGLLLNTILMNRFIEIEHDHISNNMERTINTINERIIILSNTAYDWAVWDDTYRFIDDGNDTYIKTNLVDEIYDNLNLSTMVFINNNGDFIYNGSKDYSSGEIKTISSAYRDFLKGSSLFQNTDPNLIVSGIVNLPEGPMLISSCPILKSSEEGPVLGNLIVGQYINEAFTTSLADQLKLDISIDTFTFGNQDQIKTIEDRIVISNVPDSKIRATYIFVDLEDKPVLSVNIVINRDIYEAGKFGISQVLLFIFFLSAFCILLLSIFMRVHVLSKIGYINKAVDKIGQDKDFTQRLELMKNNDEFNIVVSEINGMLDDLESVQKDIEYNANHDALTGLPNRRLLSELMKHSLHQSERNEKMLAVMFLDLDNFKMINDTKGHDVGDEILKEVANRLTRVLRKSDILARIGGDEYVVLLENFDKIDEIKMIAEKILNSFHEVICIDENDFFLTSSIGISIYPVDGFDADTLIKNADLALYKAKEIGKSQYTLCSPVLKANIQENMHLSNLLHRAMGRNELEVYYQPQINGLTNNIEGTEALLRWNNQEIGSIPPSKFIPIAEQSGLIIPIGKWVLKQACLQNVQWQKLGYPKLKVAVNISLKQFQYHDLVEIVKEVLDETGLDPSDLELEITESTAMKERTYVMEVLNKLKEMGVLLAIDDFGTDYSSLNHLKSFPFDRLKIAMDFIRGIGNSEKDEALTISIISLAKNLKMQVIAEGVETENQKDFLVNNGCSLIQGYYYSKALNAERITEYFMKGGKIVPSPLK